MRGRAVREQGAEVTFRHLGHFDRELMAEIGKLHAELKAARPEYGYGHGAEKYEWELAAEHGPRIAALFNGNHDEALRKRISRSLARLEALGLVICFSHWGDYRTHVRLPT